MQKRHIPLNKYIRIHTSLLCRELSMAVVLKITYYL